jgi:glycerol-3-phosphate acyltransferase PlsY/dolichol kinase
MPLSARAALVVLAGYFLGSLSPAYLLDARACGTGGRARGERDAGALQIYRRVGFWPAALTALVDLLKGIAAVLFARSAFAVPEPWIFLPGYAAVLGHLFPFYRRFRGGSGLLTAAGLFLFFCAEYLALGRLFYGGLLAAAATAALVFAASRNADLTGLVAFTFLGILTPLEAGLGTAGLALSLLAWFLAGMSVWNCLRHGVFHFGAQKEMKWWRVIARPFALLFIPIDLLFRRMPLLLLLGALALIFSGMDLFRMATRFKLTQLFKSSEVKRFSSMTSFLVAIFIIFLVFPDTIPYQGLAFITMGDLFSKVIGLRFGKVALLRGRTLEGGLGFVAGSFMTGWILYSVQTIPLYAVLAGPIFAALAELFSGALDDNFTVGVISSGFLYALRYFLKA